MPKNDATIRQIKNEINNYYSDKINIVKGFHFSQSETINKILLYLNNQYVSGNYNSKGQRKWFFPLHEHRSGNIDKNLDLDLKDIKILSRDRGDHFRAWLAQNILFNFLKENNFSAKLNDITQAFSRMGNIVAKKDFHGDEIFKIVDPRYLIITNPAVETLEETTVIQKHIYSQADLRAMTGVWDKKQVNYALKYCGVKNKAKNSETLDTAETQEQIEPYYEIYERYGELPESYLKKGGNPDKYVMTQTITCIGENGDATLYQAPWRDKKPFKECHFGAYKGRWWREGVIELLFGLQERYNEVNNQIANSMELGSKQLYMSQNIDDLINSAVTDLDNGDIVKGDLQRVDNSERELNAWTVERQFIEKMADDITNSYEILTGENLPSNMPYRLGALSNQNASKLFDFLREKMGIFLKEILTDWVAPELLKDIKKKDFVRIVDKPEYLEYFYKYKTRQMVNNAIKQAALGGVMVTKPEADRLYEMMEEKVRNMDEPVENLRKGMFDNFKFDFEIQITGESVNKGQMLETGSNLLQMVASNPQITENPQTATILNRVTELAGFNPTEWRNVGKQPQQPQQQQQGKSKPTSFKDNEQTQARTTL